MRREDLQIDRLSVDALVASRDPCRLRFYLLLHLRKVIEFTPWEVVKLGPFVLTGNTSGSVWDVDLVRVRLVVPFTWYVDKLQDQRTSRNNSTSSWKEVSSDYIL